MARLLLTDDEWNLIADVFPEPAVTGRPTRDPTGLTFSPTPPPPLS